MMTRGRLKIHAKKLEFINVSEFVRSMIMFSCIIFWSQSFPMVCLIHQEHQNCYAAKEEEEYQGK